MSTDMPAETNSQGVTIWITGLPFSGKKETGKILSERLKMLGYKTELLIGGELRRRYDDKLGFTKQEIYHNVKRIAFECKLLSENGVIAIAVVISPYKKLRQECRDLIGRFVEVYFRCPLEELKRRDTKGLFKRAENGELKNVAGVSIPYEESENPEIIIDADKERPFEAAHKIILKLIDLGYLQEAPDSVLLRPEEKGIKEILRETWFK